MKDALVQGAVVAFLVLILELILGLIFPYIGFVWWYLVAMMLIGFIFGAVYSLIASAIKGSVW